MEVQKETFCLNFVSIFLLTKMGPTNTSPEKWKFVGNNVNSLYKVWSSIMQSLLWCLPNGWPRRTVWCLMYVIKLANDIFFAMMRLYKTTLRMPQFQRLCNYCSHFFGSMLVTCNNSTRTVSHRISAIRVFFMALSTFCFTSYFFRLF